MPHSHREGCIATQASHGRPDAQPGYYARLNEPLLKLIPPDAHIVVEIGFGTGALAAEYRKRNPSVSFRGIELVAEAAETAGASGALDRMVVGNAEQIPLDRLGLGLGAVDCLVYGDSIEHMIDPWRLLADHAAYLRPGGMAVACIPNVAHWTVVLNLLSGRWPYAGEGLLDRSHLRFFTEESIRALFAGAGLTVETLLARRAQSEALPHFLSAAETLIAKLGIDRAAFQDHTSAYQYLVAARKPHVNAEG